MIQNIENFVLPTGDIKNEKNVSPTGDTRKEFAPPTGDIKTNNLCRQAMIQKMKEFVSPTGDTKN